jgi:hypothetical protein
VTLLAFAIAVAVGIVASAIKVFGGAHGASPAGSGRRGALSLTGLSSMAARMRPRQTAVTHTPSDQG